MRTIPAVAVALTLTGLAAPAAEAKPVKDLWATVNVCDSAKSPDDMGVRARAPGDGSRGQIYMRFYAEYRSAGKWKAVQGARSGWLRAGTSRRRAQEIGYTFSFNKPKPGTSYLTRGFVRFEWRDLRRRHGKLRRVVVRRAQRHTVSGHPTKESEPKGFSAARCTISTPPKPAKAA
jgi:hypothetical protein